MEEARCGVNNTPPLFVEPDKTEEEFQKDFGNRLRLVKGAIMIEEIGNKLKCSIITVSKAKVLFHRYRRLREDAQDKVLSLVAACLHLSIGINEDDVTKESVILEIHFKAQELKGVPIASRQNPSSEELKTMRESLLLIEHDVCREFAYDIENKVAHVYVFKFLAQLQSVTNISTTEATFMSKSVAKLLNTYYLCDGCLDFKAIDIAAASLKFIYLLCGCILPSVKTIFEKELDAVKDKDKIHNILSELNIVTVVSTKFNQI